MTSECEKALQEAYAAVLLEQRSAARAENRRLREALTSLLQRVRPDVEAAPWVIAELKAIAEQS